DDRHALLRPSDAEPRTEVPSSRRALMLTALHFFTHIGLSWIVGAAGHRTMRDRWLIVGAGVLPDLDGIGILWGQHAYDAVHRATQCSRSRSRRRLTRSSYDDREMIEANCVR